MVAHWNLNLGIQTLDRSFRSWDWRRRTEAVSLLTSLLARLRPINPVVIQTNRIIRNEYLHAGTSNL
jgi:hypothetical protein